MNTKCDSSDSPANAARWSRVKQNAGEIATALVVDEIGDITEVPNNSVEPPVSIIDRSQADFISGSVFVDGAMIGLLNVARVLEPVGLASRH